MAAIEPPTDYDSPWKESISLYFRAFLAFFFPHVAADINWDRGYEFLDKELQQITRDAEIGEREADKLVKVWRRNGDETWLLVHVEIQSQAQAIFAERMYVYNNRIFDRYRRRVVSLAILADERPSWRPTEYTYEIWGCRVLLRFPTVKLLDYRTQRESLERSNNPFAVMVAAHLDAQQTRKQPQQRYRAKLTLVKSLYRRGYSREDILELFRLIDWMMSLPASVQREFNQEIARFEEEQQMPYVTSVERLARQEGQQEGRQEGRQEGQQEGRQEGQQEASRENTIEVLQLRFGEVPEDLLQAIARIDDLARLKMLHRQAIVSNSLEEFRQRF